MKIETLAVHAGHGIDPTTGAVAPPIHLSTTFERDIEGSYSRGFMYTRNSNPNRGALEKGISALEGGFGAAAFSSGTGATMSILQALKPGEDKDFYRRELDRMGWQITAVNYDKPDYVEYEIVKGPSTYEVQIDLDKNSQKANKVSVGYNLWKAEATNKALKQNQEHAKR